MWEEFRSHALALLGQHFPPELIEDNGDSIVFTDRRSPASYLITENARRITIGYYGERNTVSTLFTSLSIDIATVSLTFLVHDGGATLTDMSCTPQDLLGPVPHTTFTISKKSPPFFNLTSTIDPTAFAK